MSVISTSEYKPETRFMFFEKNWRNFNISEAINNYCKFSDWILSKSQPLFIIYKYVEKLVSKGKINNITMDILKTEIYKFINIEMNKILFETLNHPIIQTFKTVDCCDILDEYIELSKGLSEDDLSMNRIEIEYSQKNRRLEEYDTNMGRFLFAWSNNNYILFRYKKDWWSPTQIYSIEKVCNKTLKLIDTSDGKKISINMGAYETYTIILPKMKLSQLRNRFGIDNRRDINHEAERFNDFYYEDLTHIIRFDEVKFKSDYGMKFSDIFKTRLNYRELFNCGVVWIGD